MWATPVAHNSENPGVMSNLSDEGGIKEVGADNRKTILPCRRL